VVGANQKVRFSKLLGDARRLPRCRTSALFPGDLAQRVGYPAPLLERNQMQRSGLGLMVRPETSMVSRCPTQAPSFLGSRGFSIGKARIVSAPTRRLRNSGPGLGHDAVWLGGHRDQPTNAALAA
jgi:hypothetical protein